MAPAAIYFQKIVFTAHVYKVQHLGKTVRHFSSLQVAAYLK